MKFFNLYYSRLTLFICFSPPSKPDGPKLVNWSQIDQDVFTTNGSKRGWCNVDPADAYSGKAKIKEECDCKYDGLWGRLCEVPVESVCINQCSRHGHCRGGFCQVIDSFIYYWFGALVFCCLFTGRKTVNPLLFSFSICRD